MNQESNIAPEVIQLNFRVAADLDRRLSQAALDNDTTKTELVREAIENHLKTLKARKEDRSNG